MNCNFVFWFYIADPKVGSELRDDHPLSKFVKCLGNPSLQETIKTAKAGNVISLPEGVVWLGNKQNDAAKSVLGYSLCRIVF